MTPAPITRQTGRRLALAILAAALALTTLSACQQSNEDRLHEYEKSIRREADWLWNNMNYARTNYYPSPEVCDAPSFGYKAVTLSVAERAEDPDQAYLVDILDSAAFLVREARAEWDAFCSGENSAAHAAGFLESRLVPAYERMNSVLVSILPAQPTPRPGST